MGSIRSKREKVKIKNLLPRGTEFSHLNARGKITLKRDTDFDILCFEINFQGYFPAAVRLWPSNHPTSPPTPNVSILTFRIVVLIVKNYFCFNGKKNGSNYCM